MKHLRLYENFNKSIIEGFCEEFKIYNYEINSDGSIDVNGNVNIGNKVKNNPKLSWNYRKTGLDKIPIKFNRIIGNSKEQGWFSCENNKLLTLENSPNQIESDFSCFNNCLESLNGGPNRVNESYNFAHNNIKDMRGFPQFFDGTIYFDGNPVEEILNLMAVYDDEYLYYEDRSDETNKKLIKFIYWLNEFNVIRNGNTVVQNRLEEALENIKYELPENLKFENYKLI